MSQTQHYAQNPPYIGFWWRVLAYIIDAIIIAAIILPLLMLIYGVDYLFDERPIRGIADLLIRYIFPIVYTIAFWVKLGATPGKLAMGMKIIGLETGDYPSVGQAIGRYFAQILSTIPLMLGYFWIGFDSRKQGWHDKLAGTVVVRRDFDTHQIDAFD